MTADTTTMWVVDTSDTDTLPDGWAWLMRGDDYENAQPMPIHEAMRRASRLNAEMYPESWVGQL